MSFEATWQAADPDAGIEEITLDPPADGDHTVSLVETHAGMGKESGNAFVALTFEALDGPQAGHKWKVIAGFKSQGQANMTKKLVRDLGVDVDQVGDLDGLAAALSTLAGGYYNVTVKTNGQFRNTYVNGPAQGAQPDLPESPPIDEGQAPTDDGIDW